MGGEADVQGWLAALGFGGSGDVEVPLWVWSWHDFGGSGFSG